MRVLICNSLHFFDNAWVEGFKLGGGEERQQEEDWYQADPDVEKHAEFLERTAVIFICKVTLFARRLHR